MAEYREAKAPEGKRGSYKKLHHTEIEPIAGEHGGFMVMHHHERSTGDNQRMSSASPAPAVPETHLFGKDGIGANGEHLMDHLAKKLKVAPKHATEVEVAGPGSKNQNAGTPANEEVSKVGRSYMASEEG